MAAALFASHFRRSTPRPSPTSIASRTARAREHGLAITAVRVSSKSHALNPHAIGCDGLKDRAACGAHGPMEPSAGAPKLCSIALCPVAPSRRPPPLRAGFALTITSSPEQAERKVKGERLQTWPVITTTLHQSLVTSPRLASQHHSLPRIFPIDALSCTDSQRGARCRREDVALRSPQFAPFSTANALSPYANG